MTALPGWTPVIVKLLVSISVGHPRFNYRWCPDLNLRQISQSESEAQGIHFYSIILEQNVFYTSITSNNRKTDRNVVALVNQF